MLIIADDPSETDGIVDGLNEAFDGRIFAVKSSPVYVEIVKPGVNKANALDILIKKLGFKRSEAMAIGDSNNDLPMLKTAGLSVAMGNAADNVKAVCDDVTGSCTESGVAMAIEKHILKDE
jgi:Cof subfamily protein (haloacid dehalogenase superfamily)